MSAEDAARLRGKESYSENDVYLLQEKLDTESCSPNESWKPEVGDELVGLFKGWKRGITRKGQAFPIANIEEEYGDIIEVWASYKMLTEELENAQLKRDEPVIIKRYEDQQSLMGHSSRVYRVSTLEDQDPFKNVSEPLDQDWLESIGGDA
jgi:hypothetical protein